MLLQMLLRPSLKPGARGLNTLAFTVTVATGVEEAEESNKKR
jgi:hypothetical protein